jgi:hypothetical protein
VLGISEYLACKKIINFTNLADLKYVFNTTYKWEGTVANVRLKVEAVSE